MLLKEDFKILSVIGSGGSASVHAAYWKDGATKFAIKKITKPAMKEEIINEVYFINFNHLKDYKISKFIINFFID